MYAYRFPQKERIFVIVFGKITLDKLFFLIFVKLKFYNSIMLKKETNNYKWRPLNFDMDFKNLYFVLTNMSATATSLFFLGRSWLFKTAVGWTAMLF